jgi:hypothetical protein
MWGYEQVKKDFARMVSRMAVLNTILHIIEDLQINNSESYCDPNIHDSDLISIPSSDPKRCSVEKATVALLASPIFDWIQSVG